jgi:hypothetical protein
MGVCSGKATRLFIVKAERKLAVLNVYRNLKSHLLAVQ